MPWLEVLVLLWAAVWLFVALGGRDRRYAIAMLFAPLFPLLAYDLYVNGFRRADLVYLLAAFAGAGLGAAIHKRNKQRGGPTN
jgi:hypothetical protein